MGVRIDAVQARAHALLNVAQREKDKRERAKRQAAGDVATDEGGEDSPQPTRSVGGLVDRSA